VVTAHGRVPDPVLEQPGRYTFQNASRMISSHSRRSPGSLPRTVMLI
jgi:hypothetical protein